MKLYLFNSVPAKYAPGFRAFYQLQNNKSTTIIAWVWLSIALIVLSSNIVLQFGQKIQGAAYYRVAYYSYLIGAAVFLLSRWWFRRKNIRPDNRIYRWASLAYSYSFAITCLLMSVAYQGNPVNNMTMYLMGLMIVAILVVLELKELVLMAVLIELTFAIGVQFLDLTEAQQIINQTGSVFILIFFFLLSRLNYSFRANNYIQLQLIECQKQELEKVNQAKTAILGVVAHDLRGPFANIEALIKLMRVRDMSPAEKDKFYNMILQSCQKSGAIINDLLVMARYDRDKDYPLQKVNLTEFVAEVHQEWQLQLKNTRQVAFDKPEQPVFATIEPERFRRVLDNLLSNAVKFTQEHGNIRIAMNCDDREILLKISDDGIGIPNDLKPYLFDAFSKASRKGVRGEASVGLGLNIVQALVQQNQGTIAVESEASQGTTIKIILPLSN